MNRVLIVTAFASFAFAQDTPSIRLKAVKNQPFTAQAQIQSIQTLADGNRITRTSSASIARDSDGRTRREQTGSGIAFIYDPVQGIAYVVDSRKRSVREFAIPSAVADTAEPENTGVQSAAIGTKYVEDLLSVSDHPKA
ncbi:MAG TPA: hypothetical protein VHW09_08580 [Bryobacteraceae bacterium]|jgi:hypothetical protein|nr:hypothetical protein [Bryobacteraceae bacterium]